MKLANGAMIKRLAVLLPLILAMFGGAAEAAEAGDAPRPNVLLIAVDDLRPALGCYGDTTAITPHIDALARRATLFQRAYCQQAVCSPSRLSLMTGRRPDTIRVWDLKTHFREALPDVVTLPQYFKSHGYQTRSIGKIYHGSGPPAKDPPSWSQPPLMDVVRDPQLRYALPVNRQGTGLKRSATEAADVPDNTYADGVVCDLAIEALAQLDAVEQPFFLAVGFHKPHLPFCAPQKYWDLYQPDQIPAPANSQHPHDAPELAVRSWQELEGYSDVPDDGSLSADQVQHLRHGYYACVSYVDAQVGRLLERLARLESADRTVIVLWGDHGFHLGEQGLWTKANNYEWSTRVPLMVSLPGQTGGGNQTDALVELVDLYPTLVELCGLEIPDGLEGISLRPLMIDPQRAWKDAAYSQFPRAAQESRHQGHGDIMGYTIRTDQYRYVEWRDWTSQRVLHRELYDHRNDPQEMWNVAQLPQHQQTVADLSRRVADYSGGPMHQ